MPKRTKTTSTDAYVSSSRYDAHVGIDLNMIGHENQAQVLCRPIERYRGKRTTTSTEVNLEFVKDVHNISSTIEVASGM